jgi:concanavalin A-like lectin/glucanase superfamily protein
VRLPLRRVSVPILFLALSSCWLTASFSDLLDSGAGDASSDVKANLDAERDGRFEAGLDARNDLSSPPHDAADAATDTEIPSDASCVTSTTYEQSVLAAKPLAYWRLGEDGGPTARDLSEHGYEATYSDAGITYHQMGVDGGGTSILLDGVSGEILANSAMFNKTSEFLGAKAAYSLEAWIRPEAITSEFQGILSNEFEDTSGNKEGYVMYLQQDAGVGFDRYQDGASTPLTTLGVVATGSWYHVVGVYDPYDGGMTMSIYVNGASVVSKSTPLSIVDGCTFAIGATHCGTIGWFKGYMTEVAVYDYPLDSVCIAKHYELLMGK